VSGHADITACAVYAMGVIVAVLGEGAARGVQKRWLHRNGMLIVCTCLRMYLYSSS